MFIFQDKAIHAEVVGLIFNMSSEFRNKQKKVKVRVPIMPDLMEGIPWGFFDGTSQGYPPFYGVGVIIFISKDYFFKVCYVPGRGTNMKAEFSARWTLLLFSNMLKLRKVQVLGDSKVAIDWANNKVQIQVVKLQLLLNHIHSSFAKFEWSSFPYIFRELNSMADKLSKETLELDSSSFISQEFYDGCLCYEKSFFL
jgi:ribonuclease HI